MSEGASESVIAELDRYFDAAPRPDTDAVQVGPFTLFISRTPWSYYARPTIGHTQPITSADLDALAAAATRHGVDLAIEWVDEVHPELAEVAVAYGLDLARHALMYAGPGDITAPPSSPPGGGYAIRIARQDGQDLASGIAVADVSFTAGGTSTGPQGAAERDTCREALAPELIAHVRSRARRGLTVTAVAESDPDGVVAVGSYQPMGTLAELLAVATLPAARRQASPPGCRSFSPSMPSPRESPVCCCPRRTRQSSVSTPGSAFAASGSAATRSGRTDAEVGRRPRAAGHAMAPNYLVPPAIPSQGTDYRRRGR